MYIRGVKRPYKVRRDYYVLNEHYVGNGKTRQEVVAALGTTKNINKAYEKALDDQLKAQSRVEKIEYAMREMQRV